MPSPVLPPPTARETLIEAVGGQLPDLNKAFRRVGQFLLTHPEAFMHQPLQEIAARTEVSGPTVIRFCRHFGFKGIPDFRIALAMALAQGAAGRPALLDPQLGDKAVVNLAPKRGIARLARQMVAPHRSIIIDSGSTAQLFAETLRDAEPLAIFTTGLNIVDALRGATQHSILLPGGMLRHESRSLSGRMVENTLQSMNFDAVFLGADSIDPERGISTFKEEEAQQNAAMIGVARRVIVMADSSKFRAPGLHRIAQIEGIDLVISDTGLSDEIAGAITARGVEVLRAEPIEAPLR